MSLFNVAAFYGLRGTGTPTGPNVFNDNQIGVSSTQLPMPDATVGYAMRVIIAQSGDQALIDLATSATTGSDAWVAGVAQVETATAAGTITATGNASVTVTSDGMSGSPLTVSVPVLIGDTAALWAAKVRTALEANATIAARFTVGGTTTAIRLTRKGDEVFTVRGVEVPIYPADDATLNIALDNGTCTGITPAATSADTTAGVATTGVKFDGGQGFDWECQPVATIARVRAMMLQNNGSGASAGLNGAGILLDAYSPDGFSLVHYPADAALVDTVTLTSGGPCDVTLTVFGTPT